MTFLCDACGTEGAEFACSRCKVARFCGPDCFKAAWKAHKPNCKPPSVASIATSSTAPGENIGDPISVGRIFISIAAYSDPELPNTLRALLMHARQPHLLYVGLVWQGSEDPLTSADITELARLWGEDPGRLGPHPDGKLPLPGDRKIEREVLLGGRIRLVRMKLQEARGPCWARYLAQLLWSGEELYLQLDSHMRFVPKWDEHMREQLLWCKRQSPKPVLCCYGRPYSLGMPPDWVPPGNMTAALNCAGFFDKANILNIRYRTLQEDWDHPQRSFYWSAHFSFSSAEVLQEVPYDPQLLMLFYGEEILTTVRLFTHGWDLYSPARGLVFHLWERDYRKVYVDDQPDLYADLVRPSRRRLHAMLGSGPQPFFEDVLEAWPLPGDTAPRHHEEGHDPFGLGTVRTLAEYEAVADVSFKERRLGDFALRGGAPAEDYFVGQEEGGQAAVEARCMARNAVQVARAQAS